VIPSIRSEGYVPDQRGPTHSELWKKINTAITQISSGKWIAGDAVKLFENFQEVESQFGKEIATEEDQIEVLVRSLRELHPRNYIGCRPAEPAIDLAACDGLVFEFRWKSEFFDNATMYIKFSLRGKGDAHPACVHSIHPHRTLQADGK
jgi:hypothetical protein